MCRDLHGCVDGLPTHEWIDDVTPHNPVWLNRHDGHCAVANSLALRIAGISSQTASVDGGIIHLDAHGQPTGLLSDNAQNLVVRCIPTRSDAHLDAALDAAMAHVASYGVVAVHTMVTVDCANGLWPSNMGRDAEQQDVSQAFQELEVYRRARDRRRLRTRIRAALPISAWRKVNEMKHLSDDFLHIGSLKVCAFVVFRLSFHFAQAMLDGSLGTHTAAFIDDYSDTPHNRGYLIWEEIALQGLVESAVRNDLQVQIHAIGDLAVRKQLDMFERVANVLSRPCASFRFRIEHSQHISLVDVPRFGQLGVVASIQMSHMADDGCWAVSTIGATRMATSWPFKSLLNTNAIVCSGSDWFVTVREF